MGGAGVDYLLYTAELQSLMSLPEAGLTSSRWKRRADNLRLTKKRIDVVWVARAFYLHVIDV